MKKSGLIFLVVVLLFGGAGVLQAGQLADSLEQYQQITRGLLAVEQDPGVRAYLQSCLQGAGYLVGLEAGEPGVSKAFDKLVEQRLEAAPQNSGAEAVQKESEAYNTYLFPYRKQEYLTLISLQDQLLQRKYFQSETAPNANFLEGVVNGYWSLTRADHGDPARAFTEPHLGVSPWEAIFRLEPAMTFNHGVHAAILGAAGLSYTFFPEVLGEADQKHFEETFCSTTLKKSGARIGVGAGMDEGEARLLLGAGVQVRAVAVWGLYQPDGDRFLLGISASDLRLFENAFSWF